MSATSLQDVYQAYREDAAELRRRREAAPRPVRRSRKNRRVKAAFGAISPLLAIVLILSIVTGDFFGAVLGATWLGCGPLGLLGFISLRLLAISFVISWGGYLYVIFSTDLGTVPWWVHTIATTVWCVVGVLLFMRFAFIALD